MKYPTLLELNTSREMVDVFKGYNHNLRIGEGEFYEMTNLSSDNYPVLSPRPKRGIYAESNEIHGIIAKDSLCYLDGTTFVMNENESTDLLSDGLEVKYDADGNIIPKTLISMGAYVIIMPDKIYVNTANLADHGKIDAKVETEESTTFTLCTVNGEEYTNTKVQSTPPSLTEKMEKGEEDIPLWIDTSNTPHQLKQYSVTSAMWSAIATTYIKIYSKDIGLPFNVNDGVIISGVKNIPDLNASMVIWAKDNRVGDNDEKISDWIVVTGILDKIDTQTEPIKVTRQMPVMDFIVEAGNRLWGCRYGEQGDKIVNEIYASKLGDFKNWTCFMGISTDSYAASVGTDGEFTGAITHLGYPIFFKENCMHKVYGNYPSNYQIQTTVCRGVQKGCERSLATVNEVLYYKARSGICAYDGSLPMEVSSALGDISYHNAVAGTLGNKYYISMADMNDKDHLFVYDTLKGMWHREDETRALEFCNCRGNLYYITVAGKSIEAVRELELKEGNPIKWEAITGVMGTDSPDKKYISRMDVRMKLDVGSRVTFFAEYDSSGEWEYLFAMTGKSLQSFAVPVRPQRCDHLRLRVVGSGDAKIYSICKTIEQGSDV